MSDGQTAIFVGPTGRDIKDRLGSLGEEFVVFPPIQRLSLVSLSPGYTTVVIVDGYFRSVPAVGHQEIREAMRSRRVIGCSSMGAIRAAELHSFGMEGHGRVFELFLDDPDFTDDEVMLLHTPAPHFYPGSEPLVNLRFLMGELVADGLLAADPADFILTELKEMYFGYRTEETFSEMLSQVAGPEIAGIALSRLRTSRVKTRDLQSLLDQLEAGR